MITRLFNAYSIMIAVGLQLVQKVVTNIQASTVVFYVGMIFRVLRNCTDENTAYFFIKGDDKE